jgi:hypothetical protein
MNLVKPKQFTLAIAAILLLLQSCTTVPGTWKNERISGGKRENFHNLNAEAFQYLKANDLQKLQSFSSGNLNDSSKREFGPISNLLNHNAYHLLDEYYVINKYSDTDTVATKYGDIKRYGIIYPYKTFEMYFAFFAPKNVKNASLISLGYGKFKDGWKIFFLQQAPYTMNGKTAPELFAQARDEYDQRAFAAAYYHTMLAISCERPCAYWRYPEESDMNVFFGKAIVQTFAAYRFPIVLKQVSSGPMILSFGPQRSNGGVFPNIRYMTHFNLKDTVAVKKENVQLNVAVKQLMPGLDRGGCIIYSAFNQNPADNRLAPSFQIRTELP